MNNNYENEIPKYLKQKESNISKSNKKSKHKHLYEECLIRYKITYSWLPEERRNKIHTSLSSYCTICGKLGNRFKEEKSIVTDYRKTIDTPIGRCFSLIPEDDLYEKYHNRLPVFYLEDMDDDYVDLNEK